MSGFLEVAAVAELESRAAGGAVAAVILASYCMVSAVAMIKNTGQVRERWA